MKFKNDDIEEIEEIEPINIHHIKIRSLDELENFDFEAFGNFINQLKK